jgi:hypothetical protein
MLLIFLLSCCPAQVLVAIYDDSSNYDSPPWVKCRTVASPWFVNNSACYTINVFKRTEDPAIVSPMNDPTMTGTADSVWGAQCGNQTSVHAMVALKLSTVRPYFIDIVTCCPLYRV